MLVHYFLTFLLIALWYLLMVQINLSNPTPCPPSRFPQLVWWLFLIIDLIALAFVWTGAAFPVHVST
jgi:hypothetical protein